MDWAFRSHLAAGSWALGREAGRGVVDLHAGRWTRVEAPTAVAALRAPAAVSVRDCTMETGADGQLSIRCAQAPTGLDREDEAERSSASTSASLGAVAAASLGVPALEAFGGPMVDRGILSRAVETAERGAAWSISLVLAGLAIAQARRSPKSIETLLTLRRAAESGAEETLSDLAESRVGPPDPPPGPPPTAPQRRPEPTLPLLGRPPFSPDIPEA